MKTSTHANPRFLIDGYNLVHALGFLHPRQPASALHEARLKLFDFLKGHFKDEAHRLTVVFDAHRPARGGNPDQWVRGIHVLYAVRHQVADDLLEILLASESQPSTVIMVSSDSRLLKAARRKKVLAWTCDAFLDFLDRKPENLLKKPEKNAQDRASLSPEETEHWLREFGDLDNDPEMKKLGDLYRFDDASARPIEKKRKKR